MQVYVITREECRENQDWGCGNQDHNFDNCCDDIFLRKEDAITAMEKRAAFDLVNIVRGYSIVRGLEEPLIQLIDEQGNPDDNWIEYRVEERTLVGS